MPDGYGIKDLPDTGKIEDSKLYIVEGKWLNVIFTVLKQLWRGENVNKGPNIYLRQFGDGGYSISSTTSSVTGGGATPHPLTVYDASTESTPRIRVIPGTVKDLTTGTTWTPTIDGNPINVQIGSPPAYPALTVTSATSVYLHASIDNSTGHITALIVDSGAGIPTDTDSDWYLLLSYVTITITDGKASIACLNDGVLGSQVYSVCGPTPLTGGNQYLSGLM